MQNVVAFVPDSELLWIEPWKVDDVLQLLHSAGKHDQLWFAFKNTGSSTQARDLLFFQSGAAATEFALNQKKIGETYQHLPIEASARLITSHRAGSLHDPEQLISLDTKEIIKLQDEINFDRSEHMLEETMRRHHWKEMRRGDLNLFLYDLLGMHDDSLQGKRAVEQLVRKHWPDFLVETKYLSNNLNNTTMNEKNSAYLKDNIKYHGFGETLNPELESQLKKGVTEFSIAFKTEVNKKAVDATLHFKKSDSTDLYFFNKYDVRAQLEKKDETLSQTFYLNKGHGVTLKEAYNLLNGRAVHKELTDKQDQKYHAWIQLDFTLKDKNGNFERKQYHQNYGYDLKESLSYYPIRELANGDDRTKLLRSLEKGNVQQAILDVSGKEMKVFIEANPQYKTVTLYNGKMQRLDQEQRQELMVKPSHGAAKEQRQEMGQSKSESKEQRNNLTQDVKKVKNDLNDDIDMSKKNNRKKGLSV